MFKKYIAFIIIIVSMISTEVFAKKIELRFMNWWGATRIVLMENVIREFNKIHPDIIINNSVQGWDGRNELIATAAASSNPPDIIMSRRAETYKFASLGIIIPIDDYVKKSGIDLSIFYEGEINNQRYMGKLYSFPLPAGGGMSNEFFYNKELLKKAGFNPEIPPRTWQELEKFARAITEKDAYGLKVLGVAPISGIDYKSHFLFWIVENNGKIFSDDGKKVLFNSKEGVETMKYLVKFTNEINGGIEAVNDFFGKSKPQDADFPFHKGVLGGFYGNVAQFNHFAKASPALYNDNSKWGVSLGHYNGNNHLAESTGVAGLTWAWGYTIPKAISKEKQDAAYKFIEFLGTNKKGGCAFLFAQGRPSPVKECNNNPAYFDKNPNWNIVQDVMNADKSYFITPVQSKIDDVLHDITERALYGENVEELLAEGEKTANAILKEYWDSLN